VPQSNVLPLYVRRNQRRPIKRFIAVGFFMALVAIAGYSLIDDPHIATGEHQPVTVATRSDWADNAKGAPPALPVTTSSLGSNPIVAPATLSPTELAAMQAEMDAYSLNADTLFNLRTDSSDSLDDAIETTLDTLMITLHSMMAEVDAQPQVSPTAVFVPPSLGE